MTFLFADLNVHYYCLWFINMHIFMNTFVKWSIVLSL